MPKALKGGLRLLVAVMMVAMVQALIVDITAAPGRDYPRCIQQCNQVRKACQRRCDQDCTTQACIDACRAVCATNSQDCKDVCRAIRDGETPEDP